MLKKLKTSLLVAIIISVLFGMFIGFTQIYPASTQAQTENPKLTLEVSTPQSSYLQLEPIPFQFNLSNQTNQPITWKGILLLFGGNVDLLIQEQNGSESRFAGSKYAVGLSKIPETLNPGQSRQVTDLFRGVKEFEAAFPRPGNYQVRVEFTYKDVSDEQKRVTILSNPVSINIREPQNFNRQAYDYIKGPLQTRLTQNNVEATAQVQQDFVNNYGSTVYAKYVIFDLARTYQFLGEDLKALRELCKISGENFYYSKQVERTLRLIDVKLHPLDLTPLPENVPTPVRPHPCARVQN
ncbi:MAG: hypothetical protein H0W58_16580 [Acidobacteria bacterium]|jgi:hypothetical protein|nr:hypothetical protein [Acidobacteriota bacterium]